MENRTTGHCSTKCTEKNTTVKTAQKMALSASFSFATSSTTMSSTKTKSRYYANDTDNNKKNVEKNQRIKISKKYKPRRENLKFLINLFTIIKIKIILCISEINQSMLLLTNINNYTNNYQKQKQNYQTCIIKFQNKREQTKIFKISFQNLNKINFLKRSIIKSFKKIIENVKITTTNLHIIVRHFVGICLIRLISLKRLKQIPENQPDKENGKLSWRIVGNTRKNAEKIKVNLKAPNYYSAYLKQEERINCKIVGNSTKCQYFNDRKWLNVANSQICQNNSHEKEQNNKEGKNRDYCSHIEKRVCQIIGNSQFLKNTYKEKLIKNEESSLNNKQKIECKEKQNYNNLKLKYKIVGNAKVEKYLYDKKDKWQNIKERDNKSQYEYYHHINHKEKSVQKIVGNSENYEFINNQSITYKNDSNVCKSLTQHGNYFPNLDKSPERQVVGNSKNYKYFNDEIKTNKDDSKEFDCNTQHDYYDLNHYEAPKRQVVGNSQYKYLTEPRRSTDKDKSKALFNNTQHDYYDFKHHGKLEIQVVGNSQNSRYLNERSEAIKNDSKSLHDIAQYDSLNQNQIVGNSQYQYLIAPSRITDKKGSKTIYYNTQYDCYDFKHHEKPKCQVVGNSQNSEYIKESKISHKNYNKNINYSTQCENCRQNQNERLASQIVGNSQNYQHLHDNSGWKYNAKEREISQISKLSLTPIEKRMYQIVGNSENFPYCNDTSESKENESSVCYYNVDDKAKTKRKPYYLSHSKKHTSQIVGNTKNYKLQYKNCHKAHNIDGGLIKSQLDYWNLQQVEKASYQIVGNSHSWPHVHNCSQISGKANKVLYNNVEVSKERQLNYSHSNTPVNQASPIVGNTTNYKYSNCNYGKHFNDHQKDKKLHIGYNNLCHIEKVMHQIVGNSQNWQHLPNLRQNNVGVNKELQFYNFTLNHLPTIEFQIVGNTKNHMFSTGNYGKQLNVHEEAGKSPHNVGQIKYCMYYIENKNCQMVGNAENCQHLKQHQNEGNVTQLRARISLCPNIEENIIIVCQVEKENYQFVGNSRNSPLLNQSYVTQRGSSLNRNEDRKILKFSSQIEQETREIVGNSQYWQHFKYPQNQVNRQSRLELSLYHNKEPQTTKNVNKYSSTPQVENYKTIGNSQNCKNSSIKYRINHKLLINCNNEKQKLTINDNRYLTHQIDKENCQIIGNSQQSQLCKQKLTEKYHHQSCQESLTFNNATKETLKFDNKYQHVCQVEKETSQIVGNSQNCQYLINKPYIKEQHLGSSSQELLILPYHNVRDRTKSQLGDYHLCHNFCRRESQQQQQQQEYEQSEENCQHFLDIFNLFHYEYYYCWHIYGFPLLSTEIFRNLKDITTVRMLTCFKISTTLPPSTYQRPSLSPTTPPAPPSTAKTKHSNDVSSSSSCGGELTKPTIIIKTLKVENIIANQQHDFIQTHKFTTTKSAYATTTTTAAAITTASLSSTSLSSSALRVSSSEMTLAAATMPYCHYQQQQEHQQQQHHHHPNYQHLHSSSSSSSSSLYHHNHHYRHIKLPSLLLLSRTLIILILLSSLWHTSEGFHGTGVKLSPNTVKTKYGLVRGIVVRSSPSLVEAYLGIPYASPPVGSLRFMPPITPSTWKSVRNADRFSPVCPQTVPIPPNGPEALLEVPRARLAQLRRLLPLLSNQSEDCLYLNIYVPYENRRHRRFTTNSGEAHDSTKLPTILFIHGESYEWNSGNPYDGSELAAHGNVIVVTINFRLGIFGFLKTGGKESAQGNFGLMDLVAGLHWLKENLPAFGGDPQSITLLGHGTGAALANILMVSPVSSDLIQHTVLVSGSALSPWAIQKNPLFVKRRVAEQTGCHGDMLYDDLAPCLRTKTAAELLAVKIDHPRFLVGFAPFIDGTVISPNTDYAGKLSLPLGSAIVSTSGIEYANFPKRNLIFCLTSVESHLDLSAQDLEFGFNETRRDRILRTYVRNNFHYHLNEIFAVLKNEYTDWDKAIRSPLSSRDATLQFLSDGHTASSLIKLGYMHSLRGGQGYFLHFKHRTIEEEYPQRTGSVRGEDVPFWLGLPISPLFPHNYTTQEKQISRLMLRYLANFAKTGNPNQSSLSSPIPSSSSLIGSPSSSALSSSSSSSTSSHVTDDHQQVKRSSSNIVNATSSISGPINSNTMVVDVETAAAREALNLAVLYNQRRTKRTYYKRHSRSNDDHNGSSSASSEIGYFSNVNNKLDSDELPFWDAYDVVNQLYMELGNKAEIQSHYRGHKLSMWLNLIPQLHRHANMNDQSMRHHQFQDDLNNLNLYEGIVRAQIQIKPADDEETLLLPKGRPTAPPAVVQETNTTQKPSGGTTECGVDGAMFVAEMTTTSPTSDNRSLVLDSREKEMATASTGIIGNLEVLRRLSGKQFQSYTTALVATVAVGCFLLVLNILIFAGIYHQREKRARDAKTKEELQDNDTSKNSSMLKLNAMGSETGSFNGSGGAGVSGKTTVLFGEYSCYDEKSLQTKDEKLIVELPPSQIIEPNWMAACSTSTLDLLKTKHHHTPLEATFPLSNMVPIVTTATASTTSTGQQTEHLMAMEMATYNPLSMGSGLILDPTIATTSSGLLSKRGSFVGSSSQLNQYDFASVQSSDQMSFKDIENAVKVSVTRDDDITQDDDIPEPPPPPRSFQSMQHQQAQQNFQQTQQGTSGNVNASTSTASGGAGGGGILRQAGTSSATQTGGGKKRVHIQEISV